MMKKILFLALVFTSLNVSAQYRGGGNNGGYDNSNQQQQPEQQNLIQKQKLFTGGYVNLGFGNGTSNIGLAPQIGYSLTDWMDAGIIANFNYLSQRDYNSDTRFHQTTFGPGAFMRLFPVDFLFATAQFEQNFVHNKILSSTSINNFKENYNVSSLLLGAGYAGGRMRGSNTYYYFSISVDVINDKRSPYTDGFNRMIPVIRAGYNIGLFQGRGKNPKNSGYYTPNQMN